MEEHALSQKEDNNTRSSQLAVSKFLPGIDSGSSCVNATDNKLAGPEVNKHIDLKSNTIAFVYSKCFITK